MRVLITDGTERAALAAARSLVAAGYEVHVTAGRRWSLAGASRGVHRWLLSVSPAEHAAEYAAAVGRLAAALQADMLLPVTDASVEAVLEHRDRIPPHVAMPLPELRCYQWASDKLLTLDLAAYAGLAVPETLVLLAPDDVSRLPGSAFFPAVVKPHRSLMLVEAGSAARRKVGVSFVEDRDACRAALGALPPTAFPVMLQRRVEGPGEGLFMLRYDDRIVALFAHRRIREKPPAGGVSVYRESIAADPALVAAGSRLLEMLDWRGVAMVECKRDRATGRHVFMELNGRLWGSLQLAIDAGVDFPALLAASALGGGVAPVTAYRTGVRSRWFWGDVDHLYLRLTRSPRALHLANGDGSRLGALAAFLRHHPRRDREEVWRWRDPGPFVLETLQWLRVLA